MWNADELAEVANYAVRSGWKIGTHAVGDRALRTVLDAYEQLIKANPGLEPGTLVIEHAFLADAQQRARHWAWYSHYGTGSCDLLSEESSMFCFLFAFRNATLFAQMTAWATARPAIRPEKRQPPRNVPSNAR